MLWTSAVIRVKAQTAALLGVGAKDIRPEKCAGIAETEVSFNMCCWVAVEREREGVGGERERERDSER